LKIFGTAHSEAPLPQTTLVDLAIDILTNSTETNKQNEHYQRSNRCLSGPDESCLFASSIFLNSVVDTCFLSPSFNFHSVSICSLSFCWRSAELALESGSATFPLFRVVPSGILPSNLGALQSCVLFSPFCAWSPYFVLDDQNKHVRLQSD
jgi:hypothetical protein